jgi:hypothetical protein
LIATAVAALLSVVVTSPYRETRRLPAVNTPASAVDVTAAEENATIGRTAASLMKGGFLNEMRERGNEGRIGFGAEHPPIVPG